MKKSKKVIIIGAGPAGLTAAYELLSKSKDYQVVILEKTKTIGGISRTVNYKGNRMDIGGHRFFSKSAWVNEWWNDIMPMVERSRMSRILFNNKFFDYPITLKISTLKNMGFSTTFVVGCSYLKSAIHKRPEKSLEDFYINRFGKKLYSMFFEKYTENLWGRHPRDISPEWGKQRVKGLSIAGVLKDIFGKALHLKGKKVETSLIEKFLYPELGPGQMWEAVADRVVKMGGKIIFDADVIGLKRGKTNRVERVFYRKGDKIASNKCDYVVSSMPLKDLVMAMDGVPKKYVKIAGGLPYRDYITIGVLVSKLAIEIPDNWIYVHDKKVKMGRIQFFNNWSLALVKDAEKTEWLGLEYFCSEGDELWKMNEDDFARMAIDELIKLGFIKNADEVLDYHIERQEKAYPAYFDAYNEIDVLRRYLDKVPNLFLIGRNGQHRYNNMDHSMLTALEATKVILSNRKTKRDIWSVNTEKEYHEGGG